MPPIYCQRCVSFSVSFIFLVFVSTSLCAQFDTVINVPPDKVGETIGSSCQLNVFGDIINSLQAGPGFDIEVNVMGGEIVNLALNAGSTLNFEGGDLLTTTMLSNSTLNVFSGELDLINTLAGENILINGFGGTVAAFGANLEAGSTVNLHAADLAGADIFEGATLNIYPDGAASFSSNQGGTVNVNGGLLGPFFAQSEGVLNFVDGQSFESFSINGGLANLVDGSFGGGSFILGVDGNMIIEGGVWQTGSSMRISGECELLGGRIGGEFLRVEGTILQNGGDFSGEDMLVESAGYVRTLDGNVNIGSIDMCGVWDFYGGELQFGFSPHVFEGVFNLFGGEFGPPFPIQLEVPSVGELNLFGSEFAIDGVPIEGMNPGETFTIDDRDVELSGLLADGSPVNLFLGNVQFQGVVTVTEVVLGDVNRDGEIDLLDVAPFVADLDTGTYQIEADTNLDGNVDSLDIVPFINLLLNGS